MAYYVHDAVTIEKRRPLPDKSGLDTAREKAPTFTIVLSDLVDDNSQFCENTADEARENRGDVQQSACDLPEAVSIRAYIGGLEETARMSETEKILLKRYKENLRTLEEKQKAIEKQDAIIAKGKEQGDEYVKAVNRREIYANDNAEGAARFVTVAKELAADILRTSGYRYRSETLNALADRMDAISRTETDKQEIKSACLMLTAYNRCIVKHDE